MDPAVYCNNYKLQKEVFRTEDDFEIEVKNNSKRLFGQKTIYLDTKKKIESVSLGNSIPDGILFDMEDPSDIKFYLVEAELTKHPFYEHIFPQITKFLAFYKNTESRNKLINKVFSFIENDAEIKEEFVRLSGSQQTFKVITDAVENNGKILLIIDGEKPEIEEAQRVYTDTWAKLVIPEILNKYSNSSQEVLILEPDFSKKEFEIEEDEEKKEPDKKINYSESYHLDGVDPSIYTLYMAMKDYVANLDPKMSINLRKYYIVFKDNKNFFYLYLKKKKINIVPMVSKEIGEEILKNHRIKEYIPGIQSWYNGQCFEVILENSENLEEIFELIKKAYESQK